VLEGPVSGRWTVVQVDAFLGRLGLTSPRAESYLLSLAEPLAARTSELNPVGLHPDRLARLAGHLQEARMARATLEDCEALFQAERHLRRRGALLYGYAGAIERAAECLSAEPPDAVTGETEGPPRARLREALARAEGTALAPRLQWVADHWGQPAEDGTHVPVVERLPSWVRGGPQDASTVGALRHMAVQIYGPAESEDRLRAGVAVRGADDLSLIDGAVRAARRLLTERFPGLDGQFVEGQVVFGRAEPEHEGQSAGLALAALFYSTVLEHARCRTRVQIRPEVLLTGRVTSDGAVQPVEEDGLPVKVQTAFFSPKRRLAVPAAQLEEAEATRDQLLEAFPQGRLDLVGEIGRASCRERV